MTFLLIRKFFMLCLLVGASICSVSNAAYAQTPEEVNRAIQETTRIQREQQLRQQEDIQRSIENRRPATQLEMPTVKSPTGKGEGCHNINDIKINGATIMPARAQNKIIKNYTRKCLGVAEIQSILSDITAYYIEKGYPTSRVYLPVQDLSSGTLLIDVVEGRLGDIQLKDGQNRSFSQTTAFPHLIGGVLNLRDFEQGLDQINRLQSNNASLDIAPGEQVGESVVVINNEPGKRWHANTVFDNYGTKSTGRRQVAGTLSYDNLFGLNDFISVTRRETLPIHKRGSHSTSSNAIISVPFGYATFTGGWSYSNYESSLVTNNSTRLLLDGDNRAVFGTIDYVAYRDQKNKVTLSTTLTDKKSRNYIEKNLLTVSSRQLSVLDLNALWTTQLLGGSASLGIGYSRGLKLFGSLKDAPGQNGDLPKAQFDKYTLNASWFRPFMLYDQNLSWSSQLTAQAASDTLYGSEQISVGGIYTVRGFHEQSRANDDGYYIRNDLTLRKSLGNIYGAPVQFNPFLALDAGAVTGRAPGTPHGTLIGAGAGFNLSAGIANINFFAGHPIEKPDALKNEGWTTFGRLSVSF
jgi:hemolysin activation/secretion protein